MSILIYSGKEGIQGKELLLSVRERFSDRKIESFTGIEALRERFRRPLRDVDCAILVVLSGDELDELFSVRDILSHMSVILCVPDSRPETLSTAHRLYPRFVTSPEHGFEDVILVLEKMLERAERRRKAQWAAA